MSDSEGKGGATVKKKCTNSACRRVFTPRLEPAGVVCPHCGKVYPRAGVSDCCQVYLELTGLDPDRSKLQAIKRLRAATGLGLRDAMRALDRLPQGSLFLGPMSREEAARQARGWQELKVTARISRRGIGAVPLLVPEVPAPTCRVVMTRFAGEGLNAAVHIVRIVTRQEAAVCARMLRQVRREPVVLARGMTRELAESIIARVRSAGITAHLEWEPRS